MKKLLFILTLLAVMLLCTSVAFAAIPCDACGSSNTTKVGSGNWCQWDCNECGYRTSRNHNPNSYNSGLVPDSCSGRCQWCGASAIYSSHTFTTWTSDNNATCTADGTETAKCDNVQCSATNTRTEAGTALGHDLAAGTVIKQPNCVKAGVTAKPCNRCGAVVNVDEPSPWGHSYTAWTYNGDGTHTISCKRPLCDSYHTAACATTTTIVGGKELTLCPICGHVSYEGGSVDLESSDNTSAKPLNGTKLPGTLMVLVDAAPLEVEISTDAFYMFITAFHKNGKVVEFNGKVAITVDLNQHPFVMEDSIFFEMTPAELNAKAFKIVRVEQDTVDGQPVEVWHEMPFTLENGILTFETDKMGTFLMVLNVAQAPSVG